jgi:hypothetical protein
MVGGAMAKTTLLLSPEEATLSIKTRNRDQREGVV